MNMSLREFEQFIYHDADLSEYLITMTECIQSATGCEHVGIRIKDEQCNIPYACLIGFEDEDWRSTEPFINTKHDCCVCTRINEGMLDPYEQNYTTCRGSFHVNIIEEFTSNMDEQQSTRYIGKCIAMGIASVVLVPLVGASGIRGNIHVADMHTEAISSSMVMSMEAVAPIIARRIENDMTQLT